MAGCSSCGSAGTCGCSSITIPVGPAGADGDDGTSVTVVNEPPGSNCSTGGIKVTDGAGNITYVCSGLTGSAGTNGSTQAKYANTFTVSGSSPAPITITKAAIIACNALINTCISTPLDVDFNLSVWINAGSQWTLVPQSIIVPSTFSVYYIAMYDTAANALTITFSQAGTYRVVIQG